MQRVETSTSVGRAHVRDTRHVVKTSNQAHLLAQVEAEEVGLPLGLDEHQSPLLGVATILVEDTDELVLFLVLGSSMECLHHVCACASY